MINARFLAVLVWGGLTALIGVSCLGQSVNSADSSAVSAAKPTNSTALETPEAPSHRLSEAQKASLASFRELGIPIAIPTYVPDGFNLDQIITKLSPASDPQKGSEYSMVYRNAQNTCLIITAVAGGVGGGAADFEFPTSTALFGEVVILFGRNITLANKAPTPEQLRIPQGHLSSYPARLVSGPSLYYMVSASNDDEYYRGTYSCGKNTRITPLELQKVLQSMVLLK
jgi:hypothetical protein